MTKELQLLQEASNEIKRLRNSNNLMAARLDTFDKCVLLLTAHLEGGQTGMSPDLVWEIDQFIQTEKDVQTLSNQ